jgi:elongation factor P--(R)-beta-lysine ligase
MLTKKQILQIREKVIDATREFLKKEGFLEVNTSILVPALPAEAHLEIFETTLLDRNRKESKRYLITSPEVALKKLLCQGIGSCFEITKSFRNTESQSSTHNPEFSILEWYRVGADYMDVMKDTEELILHINSSITNYELRITNKQSKIKFNDKIIDLATPWPRMTVREALQKYSGFDLNNAFEFEEMKKIFLDKGYKFEENTTWEQMFDQIFLNEVESELRNLSTPIILYDYPASMAMLANRKEDDPRYAKRFEFYIAGLELGDAYDELRDPVEQEKRFKEEMEKITKEGKTEYPIDSEFIELMKNPGLPKCSGIAIGLDRLIMLFSGCTNIRDVL